MRRIFAALAFLFALHVAPASALICNSDSGFIKQLGQITTGNALTLATDCESLVDTGLPIAGQIQGTYYATSYGIVCDGVTNNTAAFATMTAALPVGQSVRVIFPQGVCLTSVWDFSGGRANFIVEGQAGDDVTEIVPGTFIVCTRADANVCFNFQDAKGYVFQNITLAYNSPTYSGTLFFAGQTVSTWTNCRFNNVQFKQWVSTTHTGNVAIYLRNVVQCAFSNVKFEHFQVGIVGGFDGETIDNTTNIACWVCTFIALENTAVLNPGPEWSFHSSWFFPNVVNGAPKGIKQTDNTYTVVGLSIVSTSFTDAGLAGKWIDLKRVRGYSQIGGVVGGNLVAGQVGASFCIVEGVHISGVYWGFLPLGLELTTKTGCAATSLSGFDVVGGSLSTTTTPYSGFTIGGGFFVAGVDCAACNTLRVASGKTAIHNATTTFAGTDGKTVTFNNSTTFGGVDGKTLNVTNSGTLAGADGWTLSIAASKSLAALVNFTLTGGDGATVSVATNKTLTVNNSITFAGTDATTMTFPTVSATIPGLAIANIFTANQTTSLSQAAQTSVIVSNTNVSTSAAAAFVATSNSGTFSASATNNPNTTGAASFTWSGASAMFFAATNAAGVLVFDTGGFNERMRHAADGTVIVGASATNLGAGGRMYVDDYAVTAPKTVAGLSTCNATSKGARSFVTDANAAFTAGIGAVVAAGGANNVPVTCDGTNWRIG